MSIKKHRYFFRLPGQKKIHYGRFPGIDDGETSIDGYLNLMLAVTTQQIEDAYDTRLPLRRAQAHRYIFNDGPESENYVFGFKFVMNYFKKDVARARKEIRKKLKSNWEITKP